MKRETVMRLTGTLLGFGLLLSLPAAAHAATKYWIGASGNFGDNTRWSTTSGGTNDTTKPGASDIATFDVRVAFRQATSVHVVSLDVTGRSVSIAVDAALNPIVAFEGFNSVRLHVARAIPVP